MPHSPVVCGKRVGIHLFPREAATTLNVRGERRQGTGWTHPADLMFSTLTMVLNYLDFLPAFQNEELSHKNLFSRLFFFFLTN